MPGWHREEASTFFYSGAILRCSQSPFKFACLQALAGAAEHQSKMALHDIHRMGDLGVDPHIVEAVLNHISGHKRGVAGTYNRSTYAKEKRAALDTWASHLQTLSAGVGKVRRLA